MSKTRQRRPRRRRRSPLPDGSVWIRTYPVTFLHDVTERRLDSRWHQLTYATRGQLEVTTDDMRRLVPADRAVWVPAGTAHTAVMRAPISMRSIFVAAPLVPDATRVRTIAMTPLLRELILHVTRIGALDRRIPAQARLAGVLIDLVTSARDVPLELPSPRDPRARRFAALVTQHPGDERPIAKLARKAGASLRTLERCFQAETGMAVGAWRRRVRLLHALQRLEAGASVTEVALDVGYANPSAFGQAFRRAFGHSPGRRQKSPA